MDQFFKCISALPMSALKVKHPHRVFVCRNAFEFPGGQFDNPGPSHTACRNSQPSPALNDRRKFELDPRKRKSQDFLATVIAKFVIDFVLVHRRQEIDRQRVSSLLPKTEHTVKDHENRHTDRLYVRPVEGCRTGGLRQGGLVRVGAAVGPRSGYRARH